MTTIHCCYLQYYINMFPNFNINKYLVSKSTCNWEIALLNSILSLLIYRALDYPSEGVKNAPHGRQVLEGAANKFKNFFLIRYGIFCSLGSNKIVMVVLAIDTVFFCLLPERRSGS